MKLVRLIYVSRVAAGVDGVQVQVVLGTSRVNNRREDVTGLLAYTGEHFLQVLEGERGAVERTMQRIARDPRHSHVRTIAEQADTRRRFSSWSMAYVSSPDHAEAVAALAAPDVPEAVLADAGRLVDALAERAKE